MPKLEIYDDTKKAEEQPVRLKLVAGRSYVAVTAVDAEGKRVSGGNILEIYENGTIGRNGSVNPSLGFQLNSSGQVKIGMDE